MFNLSANPANDMTAIARLLIIFLFIICSLNISAQDHLQYKAPAELVIPKHLAAAIDRMFNAYADKIHSPGIVYGIVANGRLMHSGSRGYTDIERKILCDTHSAFRIASMSKSFTAMAILQLRDAGKLNLDEPVSNYIPELKAQNMLSLDAPAITIRHLLTHTAGFPEDNPWGDRQLAVSDEAMLAMFRKGISFSNIPGETFEYSNMGFAMLGYIIKKVSGQPYEQFIRENILKPLNMTSTWWEYNEVPPEKLANGYRYVNGRWNKETLLHAGAYGAMGGLISTMEDFAKYVSLHLSAWPPSDHPDDGPLRRSSIREMHKPWQLIQLHVDAKTRDGKTCPTVAGYGYGLSWQTNCQDLISIQHSGGLPGFGSNWIIAPQYGVGVVCFSNVTYAPVSRITRQVLDTIISALHLQPYTIEPSQILEQRKNELVDAMRNWNTAETQEIFAENFFLDYNVDSLKKQSEHLFKKAGKIVKVHPVKPENHLRGTFTIEGEHASINVFFTLTPESPPRIQSFSMWEEERIKK
jgi:CubicO group peptidase (beta-lactamase class C family)